MYFSFGLGSPRPISIDKEGKNIFYRMFSSNSSFTSLTTDREKLNMILKNPACMRVFKINCDLASLGRVSEYKGDNPISVNALKAIQPKPNKHQTWRQWLWDYEFYSMLGTATLWTANGINDSHFYWLNSAKITFPADVERQLDKLDLTDKSVKELSDRKIQYAFKDGTTKDIPLKELQPFFDLSNSVSENWYKGNSAIDALYKVISNTELILEAQNVNLNLSKKVMVSGKQDPTNTFEVPMPEQEKKDIENKVEFGKNIQANKSGVEIQRFVDDLKSLGFDEIYLAQLFIIGSMYSIPKEVLESSLKGATYENQEKATGKHISYSIQPKMDDLMEWLGEYLGGIDLRMRYDHLPFMQYVEAEKAKTTKDKAASFKIFLEAGFSKEEALQMANIEK